MRKKNFFSKEERPDFYSLLLSQCQLNDQIMALFIAFMETKDGDLAKAVYAWADEDNEGFWTAITEGKRKGRVIKNLYWESLKKLDSEIFTLEEIMIKREFFRDLNLLSYKARKAIDRISDTKIKAIT